MSFDKLGGLSSNLFVSNTNSASDVKEAELTSQGPLKGASLTVLGFTDGIKGPGGQIRIKLEEPTIGPEDVPLNELLQQLDGLGNMPAPVFFLGNALNQLAEGAHAFARSVQKHPQPNSPEAKKHAEQGAQGIEQHAMTMEQALRNIIENSTYPNFSDFLKDMVKVAQQLREQATKAKMAAIQGNFQLMMDAAAEMLTAAQEAKSSRDKEIKAERDAAIGQLVAAVVTFAITAITFGKTKDLTFSGNLAQTFSTMTTGIANIVAAEKKIDASSDQYQADLANVAKQRLEAAAKLIEQQSTIADDLRDIAKGLRDMMLKVYQDFISAQNEVIQRSNV